LDEVLIKGNKEMLFLIPIAIIVVTLCSFGKNEYMLLCLYKVLQQ
jgi:hypothetical protein